MTVGDVLSFIDSFAPFSGAEKWDNSGLLIGDSGAEVSKALVCLDVTGREVDFAVKHGANLIVSHHPVIFSPLSHIPSDSTVYKAIKNGISVICAHTNLDKAPGGVNDALCESLCFDYEKVYESDNSPSFVNICYTREKFTAVSLSSYLKEKLSCTVAYCDSGAEIKKIALCTGAGADFLDDAVRLGCNAFITGEARYHEFLEAKEKGISLFAVGHFESEIPVVKKLTDKLNDYFNCTVFAECDSKNTVITEK